MKDLLLKEDNIGVERMIVTVFRSRVNPDISDDYAEMAERMSALAQTMPGYISHKSFTAEDGERVTIVEFESMEGQLVWRNNAEHSEARMKGRTTFYSEYKVQVCEVLREHNS
jgi:heme-degrading monooxygenase HmoA|tara:strand:- start:563 stop:901 length:339 start_codon:yes stop_codon:yes gene_type:complete